MNTKYKIETDYNWKIYVNGTKSMKINVYSSENLVVLKKVVNYISPGSTFFTQFIFLSFIPLFHILQMFDVFLLFKANELVFDV